MVDDPHEPRDPEGESEGERFFLGLFYATVASAFFYLGIYCLYKLFSSIYW
jgi:hypothetical protein